MNSYQLQVQGMTCQGCAQKIKRAFGPAEVTVDLPTGQVQIKKIELNPLQAKQKIESLGFKVSKLETMAS